MIRKLQSADFASCTNIYYSANLLDFCSFCIIGDSGTLGKINSCDAIVPCTRFVYNGAHRHAMNQPFTCQHQETVLLARLNPLQSSFVRLTRALYQVTRLLNGRNIDAVYTKDWHSGVNWCRMVQWDCGC